MSTKRDSEKWRTIRAAVGGGWGSTLRLTVIRTVPRVVTAVCIWWLL